MEFPNINHGCHLSKNISLQSTFTENEVPQKKITGKSKILYLNTTQYLLITKHSVLAYEEASISEISNSITK